jgi:hypothetical protein
LKSYFSDKISDQLLSNWYGVQNYLTTFPYWHNLQFWLGLVILSFHWQVQAIITSCQEGKTCLNHVWYHQFANYTNLNITREKKWSCWLKNDGHDVFALINVSIVKIYNLKLDLQAHIWLSNFCMRAMLMNSFPNSIRSS